MEQRISMKLCELCNHNYVYVQKGLFGSVDSLRRTMFLFWIYKTGIIMFTLPTAWVSGFICANYAEFVEFTK